MTVLRPLRMGEVVLLTCRQIATEAGYDIEFGILVVQCWMNDHRRFGLRKFEEQYPDSKRVSVAIHDGCGLLRMGWAKIVRPNVYRLTEAGHEMAVKLAGKPAALATVYQSEPSA